MEQIKSEKRHVCCTKNPKETTSSSLQLPIEMSFQCIHSQLTFNRNILQMMWKVNNDILYQSNFKDQRHQQ